MTEAYFGMNDFFPFNRAELMTAEPEIYKLLEAIWGPVAGEQGKSAREAGRTKLKQGLVSTTLLSPEGSADRSLLTVDRIFGKDEFKTQDWGPARWLKDGSGYTTLEVAETYVRIPKQPRISCGIRPNPESATSWGGRSPIRWSRPRRRAVSPRSPHKRVASPPNDRRQTRTGGRPRRRRSSHATARSPTPPRWSTGSSCTGNDTTGGANSSSSTARARSIPKSLPYVYPKAGETNSACRVGVVKASGGRTRWFRPNADPRNHYIPRMEWAEDSRHVLFQQLNRLQNTNQVICGRSPDRRDASALHRSR